MKNAIIILITGYLLFELVEHVVLPLIWHFKIRKKKAICGKAGLIGKVGTIKCWQNSEGKIFVHGELWKAASKYPLSKGEKAVIQDINGLTMHVTPLEKENNTL